MTQTLDRFRLLRTCFLNISTAELQQANFLEVSILFFSSVYLVNAHGNLYDISVCRYIVFFLLRCFTINFCLRYRERASKTTVAFDTDTKKK